MYEKQVSFVLNGHLFIFIAMINDWVQCSWIYNILVYNYLKCKGNNNMTHVCTI